MPSRSSSIHPFSGAPARTSQRDPRDTRFTISEEPGMPGRARVSGSLTGEAALALLDAVARGAVLLDLARVDRVDDSAARVLAGLRPERCTLLGCPRWLVLTLARVRLSEAA
jgi:hypothetical protein